jgi:GTP-binding protein
VFVDEVEIRVRAGAGGDGCVAFRREKHVPRGGPDGGSGGHGGSVVFEADSALTTLIDLRFQREYKAARGGQGQGNNKSGQDAQDIVIRVPVGTQVTDLDTGEVVVDLVRSSQRAVAARGGAGGRGNALFVSSTHQTPRFAEKGEPGTERRLRVELKLLADVGLVGFPNVGKSTLIARISAARPKIADYPFTTLVPNLGVVSLEPGKSFVAADVPGLIEGASEGAGLGHQFLRHLERTRLLIHLVDVSGLSGRDPLDDFHIVNRELSAHSPHLAGLQQLVALNKSDMPVDSARRSILREAIEAEGFPCFEISALTGTGVPTILFAVWSELEQLPVAAPAAEVAEITYRPARHDTWEASKGEEGYIVRGAGIERLVAMTDMQNDAAVRRLHRIVNRMGVIRRLRELGATEGDNVRIGQEEFDFVE